MRILQVTPYYPPHIGGIEYHVEALSRKLVEAGHEVTVYTSNVPKTKKHEVVDGVEVFRFNCPFAPLNNPVMPGLFLKLIRDSRFDIVHTHGHFHLSSSMVAFSSLLTRRNFVLTSHGAVLGYHGWKKAIEIIFNKTLGICTLRATRRVIALTATQTEKLKDLGAGPGKTVVIPIWIEMSRINSYVDAQSFRSTHNLGDKKIVLFVGRLLPIKGLEHLIEAVRFMKTSPTIVIIGDEAPGYPGTKQALEKQVSTLGLREQIMFLGSFPREKLADAYRGADIFVLPSLAEGLPLVLLEAMSLGKCVIATKVPGNIDVIKDGWNGILVEPKNPLALAEKIDLLLTDGASREKLGVQARKDIEQNYSSDKIISHILDLYFDVR
ncbi:MAG: glycosyltransferase family 4 protein [Chloroflexi bacterium]|nr:glycosyltransferase family 4 protein [Chloroflexota bacterium]MBM3708497.1 glycosyltransferase family 4 protein [Actinomycetota bacterium]